MKSGYERGFGPIEQAASGRTNRPGGGARTRKQRNFGGFTLTELLIALAIVAILVSVAVPAFERQRERAKVYQATNDVGLVAVAVSNYYVQNREYPTLLAEVGYGARMDPWGRPYQYYNLQLKKGNGDARKDKKLNPLNSDFDLYSLGKDGKTKSQLTNKDSRDDVVRARDGKFVGLASEFDP